MPMSRQSFKAYYNHYSMSTHSITTTHHHHHHHLRHQLFLGLLFGTLFFSATSNEVDTLISWIHSSSSSSSAFSSWNPLDSNPCKWSYISCSSDNFVTEINIQSVVIGLPFPSNLSSLPYLQTLIISNSNLSGDISPDMGDCTRLTVLDVSSNNLGGSIPKSIGKLQSLQNLVLNSNQLTGEIPAEIGNCSSLRNLLIFDNYLSGHLPSELGRLPRLESIRAGGNKEIGGNIPDELGECQNLQVLGLADTKISGSIPPSLGKLSKLQTLSVYTTMLSGKIPAEIGNCSELIELFLHENDLSRSLPSQMGKLLKLEKLLLWQNNFQGTIPEEIGNCRNLRIIDLSLNFFSGPIPRSFGNLSNLEELMLSNNNISGSIQPVLSNATNIVQLQLDTNQISGFIPAELGMLKQLTVLFAWQNKLEGSIPDALAGCSSLEALDLSHNALTGSLPPGLFQLQNLSKLLIIDNEIYGSIPPEIGNCSSLIRLRLVNNRITGEVPKEIGCLKNLDFLDLSENRLVGSLPDEIGNCNELQMLNLSNNTIVGTLPGSISDLSRLQVLDVSVNKFVGEIPVSFGNLTSLNRLILSKNFLTGSIPTSLGQCSNLQLLDLSSNALNGTIPVELFDIVDLDIALNLSWNSLSGVIQPQISALNKLSILDLSHNKLGGDLVSLVGLENLVSLNISNNNFTGYLPDSKVFRQLSPAEFAGNKGLCSKGHDSCFISNGTNMAMLGGRFKGSLKFKLAIALLITFTIALSILGFLVILRARKSQEDDCESDMGGDSWPWQFTPFQKLTFSVDQVLKCLVEANVIGKGCSGTVYCADLGNGQVIAVKKLWPAAIPSRDNCQNDKIAINDVRDSFSAEVRTLGSIRHKNIVRFLGCCWNRNTKLLLYDYMPNGSLGSLLHERSGGCLEWDVRYKIVLEAAQGLAYLHHDCVPPILHRDIKANNILIGPEFEPYIADFGLAKLVDDGDFARSSATVAGSYGYIAPEYGYMMKITEKSDVYSYGVVVLEVLTGKQPIDPTIPDGLHIVDWVRQKRGSIGVLDSSLRARPESEIEEMLQTLGVALLCVNPNPDDRPTIKDVSAMLKEIRLEKEEGLKVEMLVNTSSANNAQDCNNNESPSLKKMQSQYNKSNNTSFSASSLLHSSLSTA